MEVTSLCYNAKTQYNNDSLLQASGYKCSQHKTTVIALVCSATPSKELCVAAEICKNGQKIDQAVKQALCGKPVANANALSSSLLLLQCFSMKLSTTLW